MAVVQDLEDSLGVCMGHAKLDLLGNLPAVSAEWDPTAGLCPDLTFHQPGIGTRDVIASGPSTLLVAITSHGTIGVLISAQTKQDYWAWLPIAREYVDSFVFTSGANHHG